MIWCPDPGEIEMQLRLTHIVYPRNVRQINFGYQHVAVIPALYAYVTELQQVPTPEEACRHLWPLREVDEKRKEETRERTIKLVLDFFRELHTFGLLAKHNAFGLVTYAGATDVDLGVDYTARMGMLKTAWMALASSRIAKEVGIQAQIGGKSSYDPDGRYQQVKRCRKERRGAGRWDGPIYFLTNANRPALISKPSNTWLFTWQHIGDLVDEIIRPNNIAIQLNLQEK